MTSESVRASFAIDLIDLSSFEIRLTGKFKIANGEIFQEFSGAGKTLRGIILKDSIFLMKICNC